MSDWHMGLGLGQHWGGYISWGLAGSIVRRIIETVTRIIGKKIYTCTQCEITGIVGYQFYKVEKIFDPFTVEIKCKHCYAVVGEESI